MRRAKEGWVVLLPRMLLIAALLLAAALSVGALSVEITPPEVPICGLYPNISMVSARVQNDANHTISNLTVVFSTNNSGLATLSGGSYSIESLGAGNYSPVLGWVFGCGNASGGAYKTYLTISSSEGQYSSESSAYSLIKVSGVPPQITSLTSAKTGEGVIVTAMTNKESQCRIGPIEGAYDSLADLMLGTGTNHSLLMLVNSGTHTYYVRCKDAAGNTMESSASLTFKVDSTKPVLSINLPTQVFSSKEVNFNVSTDEASICEIAMLYPGNTTVRLQGAGLLHIASLTLEEGFYSWKASCADPEGNVGEAAFSLEVNLLPTAEIDIKSNSSRLGVGVYRVEVTTSENMASPPSLNLVVDNSRTNVPLEGANKAWSGYMIIENRGKDLIGSFEITMIDPRGNVGHGITSGSSFVIDTTAPPAPQDLEASLIGGKAALSWYYAGESIDHFNIYRSEKPYVGLASFRASTEDKRYYDSINLSTPEYYYAVAAVDLAGNEGPLSAEAKVELVADEKQQIELAEGGVRDIYISNKSLTGIEAAISEAGKLSFDLKSKSLSGSEEEKSIRQEIGMQKEIDAAISSLSAIQGELELLKFSRLKDFEIDSRLETYWGLLKELKSTPSSLKIVEETSYAQLPEINATELVGMLPVDASYSAEYLKSLQPYLSSPTLEKRIINLEISHLNGLVEQRTLIRDSLEANLSQVILLVVPTSGPEVEVLGLEQRPLGEGLIRLPNNGQSTVSYLLNGTLGKEEADKFFTIAIPDYSKKPEEAPTKAAIPDITGKLIFGLEGVGLNRAEIIVIISGLVIIGILLMYYLVLERGMKISDAAEYPSLQQLQQNAEAELSELQKIAGKEPAQEVVEEDEKRAAPQEDITEVSHKEENKQEEKESASATSETSTTSTYPNDRFGAMIQEVEKAMGSNDNASAIEAYNRLSKEYALLPEKAKASHYKRCIELYKKLSEVKDED